MDIRMYVMTHKKLPELPDSMYIPLQVGKAGKEDFGYLGDNTGDNISEKNAAYCELTGIYWLWKNMDCDVIGICHYRRYFTREELPLDRACVESLMRKYDIVIPNSACVKDEDVYDHYQNRHYAKDLDMCREVIVEKYPEYVGAFDFSMRTVLVSVGNMWITRKNIFDRYCEWLFDILFEVEKRIDTTGYDDYQGRVMGFLSERLFRVWLFMQETTITEENVTMIALEDIKNAKKRMGLVYQYVKLKIQPVIQIYRSQKTTLPLKNPADIRDDFEGKIPVWLCCLQGEEMLQEEGRRFLEKIKDGIPKNGTVLRVVTLENCMEYVTFSDTVIRKFNEGKIGLGHLTDLLRAELLYRYGGVWLDAAQEADVPLTEELLKEKIYTVKEHKSPWTADISGGRWSNGFWIAEKGQKLFGFLLESLWYYWEMEEAAIADTLADYVLAAGVEEFPDICQQWKAVQIK